MDNPEKLAHETNNKKKQKTKRQATRITQKGVTPDGREV